MLQRSTQTLLRHLCGTVSVEASLRSAAVGLLTTLNAAPAQNFRLIAPYSLSALSHMPDVQPSFLRPSATEPAATKENAAIGELSLKAKVIFDTSWKQMETKYGDKYVCPRELVLLNGAPGSGKGTNMPFIMRSRGLSKAITMSQLLERSPGIKDHIDKGELVPDAMVLDALLDSVVSPDTNDGAGLVIDGFPRTALQVDFVKLLFDKLTELSLKNADTKDEWRFPRPSFKVVVLYVSEEESVKRQMRRAQMANLHNQRVLDAGTGDVWDVRTTDISEALCRRRYQVFKAHYHTILRLKQYFPFSLIDAMGSPEDCRAQIMTELRYQSSLDLDEKTYAAIRHLPLARDLVRVARQRLVFRLDLYCKRHTELFLEVIRLIGTEVIPLLKQCSLAGHAEFKTRHHLVLSNPLTVDMLVDVLSDRGFSVAHSIEDRLKPIKVDMKSGHVECQEEEVHKFRITFDKENVRDLSMPSATAASTAQQTEEHLTIATTFVPQHMRSEGDYVDARHNGTSHPMPRAHQQHAMHAAAGSRKIARPLPEEEIQFLKGFDSMDHELSEANRNRRYGFEEMNSRED